jgi:hypothetical protein
MSLSSRQIRTVVGLNTANGYTAAILADVNGSDVGHTFPANHEQYQRRSLNSEPECGQQELSLWHMILLFEEGTFRFQEGTCKF